MGDKSCYAGLPKAMGGGGYEGAARGSGAMKGGVSEEYAGGVGGGGHETYAGGIPKGQTPQGSGGGAGSGSADRSCYAGLPK